MHRTPWFLFAVATISLCLSERTAADGVETVAAYDHRIWWVDSSPSATRASFDPERFEEGPLDESFCFETRPLADSLFNELSSPSFEAALPVFESPLYREFLAERNLRLPSLPLSGTSFVLQGNDGYHLQESGFGDFAWDFAKTDDSGSRFEGEGLENIDYFAWGEPVYLPRGGFVAEVVRSAPDNPPGTILGAQSNLVGIRITGKYYVYFLHFQADSIPLSFQVGDFLPGGTFLGRVGNSGVSLEPHLHMTYLWLDVEAQRYWSIPTAFESLWVSRDGDNFRFETESRPRTGEWVLTPGD